MDPQLAYVAAWYRHKRRQGLTARQAVRELTETWPWLAAHIAEAERMHRHEPIVPESEDAPFVGPPPANRIVWRTQSLASGEDDEHEEVVRSFMAAVARWERGL